MQTFHAEDATRLAWTSLTGWHWTSVAASYGTPIAIKDALCVGQGSKLPPYRTRGQSTETAPPVTEKTLLERLDIGALVGALLLAAVSLTGDPWWTITSSNVISVTVSPFYTNINAAGLSDANAAVSQLGIATRILVISASLLLGIAGLKPMAWWRKPLLWFGYTSVGQLFLSLFLMIHAVQTALLGAYGYSPPLLGQITIQGLVLGLDSSVHQSPVLQAGFSAPFAIAVSSALALGFGEIYYLLHNIEPGSVASELTKGLKEVHLSPPYHHIWVSTNDPSLNPLGQDPDILSDDQLSTSFNKLNQTLAPGGLVSIVVPAWAKTLAERLLKILPSSGLHLERNGVIYRLPGKPESELVFRKPILKTETLTLQVSTPVESAPAFVNEPSLSKNATPPQESIVEPDWNRPRMTRQQHAMLRSAFSVIERHKEPVIYRDLINEVYIDLIDRNVEFESAKAIENTLLSRLERELIIVEGFDESTGEFTRKWWLGEQGIPQARREQISLRQRLARTTAPAFPKLKQIFQKLPIRRSKPRYKKRKSSDDD